MIPVELVYALADRQALKVFEVPAGTTLGESIELSGIRKDFPELVVDPSRVGVFSVKAEMDRVLVAGDRVEIYRALIADPKEARRKRALAEKS